MWVMWEGQLLCEGVHKRQAKGLHCDRNHHAGSAQCQKRIKEVKVDKIRAEKGLSC